MSTRFAAVLLCLFSVSVATGQEADRPTGTPVDTPPVVAAEAPAVSRALILCGLLGDEERRKSYAEMVEQLVSGLTTHQGFERENVILLWCDALADEASAGAALKSRQGPATREEIIKQVAQLEGKLQANDSLWVFMIGHSHYDGRYSWFNVTGPDIHHVEFGKLFANIRCRQQVFFLTTSASGYYTRSLAAPGRIVIAATEADLELNETLYPQHLSKTLAEPPLLTDMDVDEDGQLSLLDLHVYTCRKVAQEYADNMLLATEHALLDDNGDGRGTEVQADYLTEELGGRRRTNRDKPARKSSEGALAAQISLVPPPTPPRPVSTDGALREESVNR